MSGVKRILLVVGIVILVLGGISFQGVQAQASTGEEDGSYRAFWVQAFELGLKSPQQIDQLVADVKAANMNAIIAQVVRRHDAYYVSEYLPFTQDPSVVPGFDPLGYLLEKAHQEGIEVHAWVVLGPMWHSIYGGAPQDPNHIYNVYGPHASDEETWITKGYDGSIGNVMQPYVDFGHPEVVEHFVHIVQDLLTHYQVDGIHLDYVRYPENPGGQPFGWYGYNPTALQRFQEETGRLDRPHPSDQEWLEWKVQQVDAAVKRIYLEATAINIDTVVSAAVLSWGFADPRTNDWWNLDPVQRAHQNWKKWVQEGYLDYTFVMNYDNDADPARANRYNAWIEWQKDLPRNRGMVIGPALYMNTIPNSISQINRALAPSQAGQHVEGISPYVYNVWSNDNSPRAHLLQSLVESTEWNGGSPPFSTEMNVPTHSWKEASNGHLLGRLVNKNGEPLTGVPITLSRGNNGPTIIGAFETDSNGYFGVTDLLPGQYFITIAGGPLNKQLLQVKPREVTKADVILP
ncbi:uncharacterized lipoprotein YddW (UPF0748 family) [Bacillus horti]|uniref:Uncharacterized lipoprotein YddW (UPF0748 family) n=1 Tax=Caldalkalibacillus horti TaxID=77523 RepID=A0ABT9VTY4_9BACI|nr:family 10 glycosylhydrolase [Bacillus horti]MDQ0164312.1 uncharacterized lipoprotein YddW (UPF0748 family) [Bacillus horti]